MNRVATVQPHMLKAGLLEAGVPTETAAVFEDSAAPATAGRSMPIVGSAMNLGRIVVGGVRAAFGGGTKDSSATTAGIRQFDPHRRGIPHGVENVLIRARNVRVMDRGQSIAYCNSHSYEALETVPPGDEGQYPQEGVTDVACKVPRDGFYDVLMRVSVNGTMHVRIEQFEPCTV